MLRLPHANPYPFGKRGSAKAGKRAADLITYNFEANNERKPHLIIYPLCVDNVCIRGAASLSHFSGMPGKETLLIVLLLFWFIAF